MAYAKMVTAMCDQCFMTAKGSGQTQAIALKVAKTEGWKLVNNGSGQHNWLLCYHCLNDGIHPTINTI